MVTNLGIEIKRVFLAKLGEAVLIKYSKPRKKQLKITVLNLNL